MPKNESIPAAPVTPAESPALPGFDDHLERIESSLRARGMESAAREIGSVRTEASWMGALSQRLSAAGDQLRGSAQEQWRLFRKEMEESRELFELLTRRVSGEIRQFTPEQEARVREQIGDLFRAVPATALALAPVPGAMLITPYVMYKLNLLPSSWREANLIVRLERTAAKLEEEGSAADADAIRQVVNAMKEREREREKRSAWLSERPSVRRHYDQDGDGRVNEQEWRQMLTHRDLLIRLLRNGKEFRWYASEGGNPIGPLKLEQLLEAPLDEDTLIYAKPVGQWIPIALLFDAVDELQAESGGTARAVIT